MKSAQRRSNGCWTCRLRRKKCDVVRPQCGICTALAIPCHFGSQKPAWMDGGEREDQMIKEFKTQIRQNAQTRRERQAAVSEQPQLGGQSFIVDLEEGHSRSSGNNSAAVDGVELFSSHRESQQDFNEPLQEDTGLSALTLGHEHDEVENFYDFSHFLGQGVIYESEFQSKYIDHVFPFIFPFYRPGLLDTGGSWLLLLLKRNKVAFHSSLSLSALYFSVSMDGAFPGQHDLCKTELWNQLSKQADQSFETIQRDLQRVTSEASEVEVVEKARLLGSIIMLLVFEASVGRSASWLQHLAGASALFEDIWNNHGLRAASFNSKYRAILDEMTGYRRYSLDRERYFWTPDQTGFRFFTSLLLFIDIIASTSLQREPTLMKYHDDILAETDFGPRDYDKPNERLSAVIGCQNWVMVCLSKVIALDAWQQAMKKKSSLSMTELVTRANQIKTVLQEGITELSTADDPPPRTIPDQLRFDFRDSSYECALPTKIWAHATEIYLAVVVSGWQSANIEISLAVSHTLKLLQKVTSPAHLRTLAWPYCVAGCIASRTELRQGFRDLVSALTKAEILGSLSEALQIMEQVWQYDGDHGDLTKCLQVLGHPVLFI